MYPLSIINTPAENIQNQQPITNNIRQANIMKCWICDKQFYNSCSLYAHNMKHHKKQKLYKCNICNARFPFLKSFVIHYLWHKYQANKLDMLIKTQKKEANVNITHSRESINRNKRKAPTNAPANVNSKRTKTTNLIESCTIVQSYVSSPKNFTNTSSDEQQKIVNFDNLYILAKTASTLKSKY